MRRPQRFLPFGAGLVLAALTGTVFSARSATLISLATALMLGAAFHGRPFEIGALLMSPLALASMVMIIDNGLPLILFALVANAAAMVLLGLVAAGGALLGEVFRDDVAHHSVLTQRINDSERR